MEHIRHLVTIQAPASKVFEAISTQQGLANWWTEQTVAKPEVGFVIDFRFGPEHHKQMRITGLEHNKSVTWQCVAGDPEWMDTIISFELEAGEGKTVLRFAHNNWAEATDYFGSCNFHWGYFIQSLRLLCETGEGTPFRPSK